MRRTASQCPRLAKHLSFALVVIIWISHGFSKRERNIEVGLRLWRERWGDGRLEKSEAEGKEICLQEVISKFYYKLLIDLIEESAMSSFRSKMFATSRFKVQRQTFFEEAAEETPRKLAKIKTEGEEPSPVDIVPAFSCEKKAVPLLKLR